MWRLWDVVRQLSNSRVTELTRKDIVLDTLFFTQKMMMMMYHYRWLIAHWLGVSPLSPETNSGHSGVRGLEQELPGDGPHSAVTLHLARGGTAELCKSALRKCIINYYQLNCNNVYWFCSSTARSISLHDYILMNRKLLLQCIAMFLINLFSLLELKNRPFLYLWIWIILPV